MTDKKTLTPQDVLAALTEVELGDFRPHLEQQLKAYTALMNNKRESKKKGKSGKDGSGGQGDDQPGSKRLKRDGDDKRKTAASGSGTSSTAGATARETGSRNPGEALDDDDDTEPMDDTNLSNEEDEEEDARARARQARPGHVACPVRGQARATAFLAVFIELCLSFSLGYIARGIPTANSNPYTLYPHHGSRIAVQVSGYLSHCWYCYYGAAVQQQRATYVQEPEPGPEGL